MGYAADALLAAVFLYAWQRMPAPEDGSYSAPGLALLIETAMATIVLGIGLQQERSRGARMLRAIPIAVPALIVFVALGMLIGSIEIAGFVALSVVLWLVSHERLMRVAGIVLRAGLVLAALALMAKIALRMAPQAQMQAACMGLLLIPRFANLVKHGRDPAVYPRTASQAGLALLLLFVLLLTAQTLQSRGLLPADGHASLHAGFIGFMYYGFILGQRSGSSLRARLAGGNTPALANSLMAVLPVLLPSLALITLAHNKPDAPRRSHAAAVQTASAAPAPTTHLALRAFDGDCKKARAIDARFGPTCNYRGVLRADELAPNTEAGALWLVQPLLLRSFSAGTAASAILVWHAQPVDRSRCLHCVPFLSASIASLQGEGEGPALLLPHFAMAGNADDRLEVGVFGNQNGMITLRVTTQAKMPNASAETEQLYRITPTGAQALFQQPFTTRCEEVGGWSWSGSYAFVGTLLPGPGVSLRYTQDGESATALLDQTHIAQPEADGSYILKDAWRCGASQGGLR